VNVSYTEPLGRAWDRMKRILFRPFRLEAWLVFGFSSFLVGLFGGGGGIGRLGWKHSVGRPSADRASHAIESARDQLLILLEKPAVLMGIAAALLVVALLLLLLTWVSARAQFVFLENVDSGRSEFVAPWSRSNRLGTSLFLWKAAFSLAWLLPLLALVMAFAPLLQGLFTGEPLDWPATGAIVFGVALAVVLALPLAFVHLLLGEFVVPLMYRYQEGAILAWARFWPLLTANPGAFVAYAMFVVVLSVAAGIGMLVVGLGTCCVGIVLIIIPYIGSVVLLPIHVTWRALGPEFLSQFGPEWTVFQPPAAAPQAPTATPPVT
jgi:hypothetical protein